jgi:hypothetical protein
VSGSRVAAAIGRTVSRYRILEIGIDVAEGLEAACTEAAPAHLAELMGAVIARFGTRLEHRVVRRSSPGDDDGAGVAAGCRHPPRMPARPPHG